jgi:hypothetical protein
MVVGPDQGADSGGVAEVDSGQVDLQPLVGIGVQGFDAGLKVAGEKDLWLQCFRR